MGVKKQVGYGGDPLFIEVFKGLEETLSTIQDEKKNAATTGEKGLYLKVIHSSRTLNYTIKLSVMITKLLP